MPFHIKPAPGPPRPPQRPCFLRTGRSHWAESLSMIIVESWEIWCEMSCELPRQTVSWWWSVARYCCCTTTHQAGLFFSRLRLQPGAQRPTPHTTPHHTRPEQNIIHSAQRLRERSECLLRLQRKTSRPLQHWHWQLTGPSSEITGRTTFTFILFKIIIGSISSKKPGQFWGWEKSKLPVYHWPISASGGEAMICGVQHLCTVQYSLIRQH